MNLKNWCFALLATLGLCACQMDTSVLSAKIPVTRSVTLSAGNILVAAPSGYCIDPASVQNDAAAGFVLLGSCTGLQGRSDPSLKGKTAMLTVSVSGALDADMQVDLVALGDFFSSNAGVRALARDGEAASLNLLSKQIEDNALLLHADDSSLNPVQGLASDYWRAIFVLRGRLVTVTVSPFMDARVSDAAAKRLLIDFEKDLRARNRSEVF